jgi:hypothetical protein
MKAEVAKSALPTEPEPGIKWRRDVAEVDLAEVPAVITDTKGNKFSVPKGYGVTVERWTLQSDHELRLGGTYGILSKRFGKETLNFVTPLSQVSRIGNLTLYTVQKIKPLNSAPAKSTKEVEIDERFTKLDGKIDSIIAAITRPEPEPET